ncbi:MAG: hypothetical protein AAGA17_08385 [Actinomycetota bacterium]
MPDVSRRAERRLTGDLRHGERFVVAGVVQPPGSLSRALGDDQRRPERARRSAVAQRGAEEQAGSIASPFPSRNGELAATEARLRWLHQGRLGVPIAST